MVSVRQLRESEVERMVRRLWVPFTAELADGTDFSPADDASVPTAIDARRDRLDRERAVTLVAADAGGLVGFVGGECLYASAVARGTELAIDELYVRPEERERGIGRTLLSAIEDWGRRQGCDAARVAGDLRDDVARSLYRSAGYREHRSGMVTEL